MENEERKVEPRHVLVITDSHIRRYKSRIENGNKFVNIPECRRYLAIWVSIKEKGAVGLSQEELNEVNDALDTGEWDHLFADGPEGAA